MIILKSGFYILRKTLSYLQRTRVLKCIIVSVKVTEIVENIVTRIENVSYKNRTRYRYWTSSRNH